MSLALPLSLLEPSQLPTLQMCNKYVSEIPYPYIEITSSEDDEDDNINGEGESHKEKRNQPPLFARIPACS